MSGIDPEVEFARDRLTPGGLRVTYDDGQNVRVDGMAPCPWCGPKADARKGPYIQTWSIYKPDVDARTVCPICHVSTTRDYQTATHDPTGRDVTRDLAIEKAVERWNRRSE